MILNKEKICSEIISVLQRNSVPFVQETIEDKLYKEWADQKEPLIDLFSRHPNWNEDDLSIKTEVVTKRPENIIRTKVALENLLRYCSLGMSDESAFAKSKWSKSVLVQIAHTQFVTPEAADWYEGKVKCVVGMKTSKVVNRLLTELGCDCLSDYNKYFAVYSDKVNPVEIKSNSFMSLHPCDFLNMSNGKNWQSCHRMGGEFRAGTMSYLLDDVSFVYYGLSPKDERLKLPTWDVEKLIRAMCFFKNDVLFQSRIYPGSIAENTHLEINEQIKNAINIARGIDGEWSTKTFDYDLHENSLKSMIRSNSGALQYPDYYHGCDGRGLFSMFDCETKITSKNMLQKCEDGQGLKIGAMPLCTVCGEQITDADRLHCCLPPVECSCCGKKTREQDIWRLPNGEIICMDCLRNKYDKCERCGGYHKKESFTNLVTDGGGLMKICKNCMDELPTCSICGKKDLEQNIGWISDDGDVFSQKPMVSICHICAKKEHYKKCDFCGLYHPVDNFIMQFNGKDDICVDCSKALFTTCTVCGGTMSALQEKVNGLTVCPTCKYFLSTERRYEINGGTTHEY